jgi:hypothetical protein
MENIEGEQALGLVSEPNPGTIVSTDSSGEISGTPDNIIITTEHVDLTTSHITDNTTDQPMIEDEHKPEIIENIVIQTEMTDTEGGVTIELGIIIEFPDWRQVMCSDGVPYYFNVLTQETSWDPPTK